MTGYYTIILFFGRIFKVKRDSSWNLLTKKISVSESGNAYKFKHFLLAS